MVRSRNCVDQRSAYEKSRSKWIGDATPQRGAWRFQVKVTPLSSPVSRNFHCIILPVSLSLPAQILPESTKDVPFEKKNQNF
jgi:hypothetical protein